MFKKDLQNFYKNKPLTSLAYGTYSMNSLCLFVSENSLQTPTYAVN